MRHQLVSSFVAHQRYLTHLAPHSLPVLTQTCEDTRGDYTMISSLVLLLETPESAASVIDSLLNLEAIEVGDLCEDRLPIVVEADGPRAMQDMTDKILALDGVKHFDVTYVSLE